MRFAALILALSACSSPTGKVQVTVTPEDTVTDGLTPGEGPDNIRDGWTVTYSQFLITLGNFTAHSTTAGFDLKDETAYVLDLRNASSTGVSVTEWSSAASEIRYDQFGYSILQASATAKPAGSLSEADFALMRDNGYSLYFSGRMSKGTQVLTFTWGFKGSTRFSNCGAQGQQPGFAVATGQTTSIEPTIHGDHWFFANTPHATTPVRLAQWIALCDDNADGDVSLDEIAAHSPAELFPVSAGYNLSSLPVKPIRSGFDFFAAQSRTLGHFQGDGECEGLEVLARDPREPADVAAR